MNTEDKRWYEIFDAYFRKLSKRDVQIWEDEFNERFNNNFTEDELIKAIKNLAEMKRKGVLEFAGCNNVITQVIKERYERKKAQGGATPSQCALCCGGWMSYFADSITNRIGYKTNGYYEFVTPCLCSEGRKIMESRCDCKFWPDMVELAERVKEWKLSIPADTDDMELKRFAI